MARRGLAGTFFALVTALASVLISAGPVNAEALYFRMYTTDGDPGGEVFFFPDGDHVKVCDAQADGWRVKVSVENATKGQYEYGIQASGSGVCNTASASMGQPWNLAEGDCIAVTIRLYDGDTGRSDFYNTGFWRNYNNRKVTC